jgi:predicted acyl esterase
MVGSGFEPLTRPGVDPYSASHKPALPPPDHDTRIEQGLLIERNCAIRLRDGTIIFADLYRPVEQLAPAPILLAWGPYGKHALSNNVFWPRSGVDPAWLSNLTAFEAPDPVFWGGHGVAVAVVDPRGAWLSGGNFHHNGQQEAEDCADAIEWLAARPWSNGRIGMSGVSYLACIQYLVAPLRPPALAALNPWEGFSDWYREFAYHGGIAETGFVPRASDNIRFSLNRTEDTWANVQAHPLHDAYWQSKELDLEGIVQPAYVVAGWADQGLHLRGTIEAWRRIASPQKWLEVHGQKKWAHYYRPESRERQRAFFDHFLFDKPTAVTAWPAVRLEVREAHGVASERMDSTFPPPDARQSDFFLGHAGRLGAASQDAGSVRYDAREGTAVFDLTFAQDTEVTGRASLRLWVEADGSDDMDVFVALQKLDASGTPVGFTFYAFYENGPVALGWLRASHRALDPVRSMPDLPVHLHKHEERLQTGQCVPLEIEIWPSSTRFAAGEMLRLVVAGHDIYPKEDGAMLPFALHQRTRNAGMHILRFGANFDARLRLPVVMPHAG